MIGGGSLSYVGLLMGVPLLVEPALNALGFMLLFGGSLVLAFSDDTRMLRIAAGVPCVAGVIGGVAVVLAMYTIGS